MPHPIIIPKREYGLVRRLRRQKKRWTLQRIADRYGVSRQRIWTIVHEAEGKA